MKRKSVPSKAKFIEQKIREREYAKLRDKLKSGEIDAKEFAQRAYIDRPVKRGG